MALTALGRRLTDQHRRAQVAVAGESVARSRVALGLLDPARLDATRSMWLAAMSAIWSQQAQASQALAAEYVEAYRDAEGAAPGPVVTPQLDPSGALGRAGVMVGHAKLLTAEGAAVDEAVERAFWAIVGGLMRDFLAPGRGVVDESALAHPDSIGWRRVTDAQPCAFCAMLASRGPAYQSAASAGRGRRFHDGCGCTVEEVFGTWQPTAREQSFIDLYERTHRPGMTAKEATAAMRSEGQGVVNDAHKPK